MPTINPISPETRAIIRAQMSRRGFIAGAGGLGAAGLLAACGTKSTSSDTAAAVKDLSDTEKVARWANWTLYLDYDSDAKNYPTLDAFQKSSGIEVTYAEDVDDNNTFYGKVAGQLKLGKDIGYDIVTLTDWMAGRWIRLGYTQAFDAANIPNKANILPVLQDVAFDPGRTNSLTWQTGFAGFGWNKELLPKGVHSVDDLFAPANKGRIEVLSEMRDTMGIIM
ncbi:MAG: spermidine/putrescine ABC transporter substrate-binding protein, partial [Actinobacteria bacterium]|nr:spermidine/putrescine ABC transporter substrate-binding protein [Actinomycetota bacterium]MTB16256.1 spermidine/putrescine ABC transporter substrate-binding protein [Actinomycetota bacterium]